jgi:hypothetical protein
VCIQWLPLVVASVATAAKGAGSYSDASIDTNRHSAVDLVSINLQLIYLNEFHKLAA